MCFISVWVKSNKCHFVLIMLWFWTTEFHFSLSAFSSWELLKLFLSSSDEPLNCIHALLILTKFPENFFNKKPTVKVFLFVISVHISHRKVDGTKMKWTTHKVTSLARKALLKWLYWKVFNLWGPGNQFMRENRIKEKREKKVQRKIIGGAWFKKKCFNFRSL